MKKIISFCLVLTSFMVSFGFVSCSRPKKDPNTITLWHWMTDRDKTFKELAAQYKELTGIDVQIELFAPSDSYTQKVVASAQAKILPDIYGVLDTKETFANFIKYGYIADLTQEFKKNDGEWEKELFTKALDANRFEPGNGYDVPPGIYGVPLDVTNIQMLYNKKLLKKAGYDAPPETYDEFLEMAKALKRIGVPGLVSGWGELWLADCFASNYAFNIMGEEKVMATYRGEVPYTDKDWVRVFQIFKDLVDGDVLVKGVVTKPNKEAEQDFALERAAFAFNGSWSVNVYKEINPDLEYGVILPPAISNKYPMRIWGGAGSNFVISNTSPNKEKAIAFVRWLTSQKQQAYLAEQTRNLPSNKKALSSISKVLEEFAQSMDNTTHPTIWPVNESPVVTEKYTKGLQSIIIGKKSPEEVAKEIQEVKEKEMEKEQRRK
ncbi:MAG: extracellular solute-binding protein [Candidatus Omnitrophica bacterium]|nr:extracellular solute-binding protein [Candidatus Omnitrophota bacterium]